MQPLIDGDILCYELGFAAEAGWDKPGFPSFDYVAELLHNRIGNICALVGATVPPIIFLTGKKNFRNDIAKTTPYKNRAGNRPFHYANIKTYLKAVYEYEEAEGLEADDLMAIRQSSRNTMLDDEDGNRKPLTIICTRDKDLRQVEGWHYGWELGNQPSFGPVLVNTLGGLRLSEDRKKLSGTGQFFFYAQCLTGDAVDTVPGLKGCGPAKAFDILEGAQDEIGLFSRVLATYEAYYKDTEKAKEILLEQGRLLWMTRELNEDGSPVLWQFPVVPVAEIEQAVQ